MEKEREINELKKQLEKIKDKTIWSYSDSYNHKLITEFRKIEKRIKELEENESDN